jgi:phospholipid/cholesterol/gamma-HCH transport system permease protein
VRREEVGRVRVMLQGRFDAATTAEVWRGLEERLGAEPVAALEVDATGLEQADGSGIALLHYLDMGGMTPGATVTLNGLKPELARLFRRFTADDFLQNRPPPPPKIKITEDLGRGFRLTMRDFREEIAFFGSVIRSFLAVLRHPARLRFREVRRVMETAGVNAVPIVSLISLLVGLIIAFESAIPLRTFGAEVFVADMIGLVMVRELGPLMTAIILAGRSGSAFAAEIGTMKVNEELNALETMGLDPVRFLVVHRIAAGVLLTPLLTLHAMLTGVLGGVVVMRGLGIPMTLILDRLSQSLVTSDILLGTFKGMVFGAIVSAVGCLRGLQTRKGPSAVGESATRSVVAGILLIIIADAVFSVGSYVLHS